MKKIVLTLLLSIIVFAQVDNRDYNQRSSELKKSSGINDRAAGIHNASNIGLFFENRGKFYPRRLTQGPSGEFPINTGQHYIYYLNPFMGIKDNVVQGKFRRNEEFEAVGGYHNPANAKVAMSDDPTSWPETGWPVKDKFGNPIILSFQDSYCAYSDELNSVSKLGIYVYQTGYAYGIDKFKNILFFKFDIVNKGNKDLNDFYFGMHSDIDVGNLTGGTPEYDDDKIGYEKDKNFLYYYDTDGRPGSEWPNPPGYFGITFLKTPKSKENRSGITDFHWYVTDSWQDVDSIEYGILSSAKSLYLSSEGAKIFHPGVNLPELRYDDPNTVGPNGNDVAAMVSWGPYDLKKDSSITIIIALVAGKDYNELIQYWNSANEVVNKYNFELSKPPITPNLRGEAGDRKVKLWWDQVADNSVDNFSKQRDFEGYRLYRSNDKGATWSLIYSCDKENYIGKDVGIQYAYVDSTVMNGFEYWYTLTAYDRGDSAVVSLESPKGNTLNSPNTVSLVPRADAIGRIATKAINISKYAGKSNVNLTVYPKDDISLDGNEYKIKFVYKFENEIGNLKSYADYIKVLDTNKTGPGKFAFYYTKNAPYEVDLINMFTDEKIKEGQSYFFSLKTKLIPGLEVFIKDLNNSSTPTDSLPKFNDMFSVNFSVMCLKGSDTVLKPTLFNYDRLYATSDGIVFKFSQPTGSQIPIRVNDVYKFKVIKAEIVKDELKRNLNKIKVVPNPYIVSSLYEPDFGELSLEPLRRLQFINLPAECVIRIFTPAGDLVKTIYHNNNSGMENWDLRSDGGREIVSGVYIYTVEALGEKFIGRFAVIK
ncbi:MAG TPA: hypothetical protein PK887_02605 [Ignavibacteriales bacterium]|nr:hypothetical protein [Ignavibacteriales bacterium]